MPSTSVSKIAVDVSKDGKHCRMEYDEKTGEVDIKEGDPDFCRVALNEIKNKIK